MGEASPGYPGHERQVAWVEPERTSSLGRDPENRLRRVLSVLLGVKGSLPKRAVRVCWISR